LHINISASDVDYIDPQLSYYVPGWALLYTTCRQLLNYPDRSGKAGTRLYADGATSPPTVSRGGRVYTFTLRGGMKFSNGKPTTARKYKFSIERATNQDTSLLQTERGSVDYDLGGHPGSQDAALGRKYGLNKKQYFVNPDISTNYFALNNLAGAFKGNLKARQAVNYAMDRKSLIAT